MPFLPNDVHSRCSNTCSRVPKVFANKTSILSTYGMHVPEGDDMDKNSKRQETAEMRRFRIHSQDRHSSLGADGTVVFLLLVMASRFTDECKLGRNSSQPACVVDPLAVPCTRLSSLVRPDGSDIFLPIRTLTSRD